MSEHESAGGTARGVGARGGEAAKGASEGDDGARAPRLRWWARAVVVVGRAATWMVMTPPRAGARVWSRLKPTQQLVLGFAVYALMGVALLSAPMSQARPVGLIDNAFNVVSAISTTGLTTVSVADSYTRFGEVVILVLFQLGGVGFMTLSSMFILARGRVLSDERLGVLRAGFAVPHYFVMQHFLVHVVAFTFACEAIGAGVLWWRFSAAGVEEPLWWAVFHAVSAFATAGFGLHNSSLEPFAGDWVINLVVGVLAYFGAIGFIVVQDVWYSIKLRERMLTFTSKVILWMTGAVFVLGTIGLLVIEPSVEGLPPGQRVVACAFQVMTASTTAGFNTIPIGGMSAGGLAVLMVAMLIGASPSGTGGGIKTTSVSAILGNLMSVVRGRPSIVWLGHELPLARVLHAFAATSVYLIGLAVGVLALAISEEHGFLAIVFEAASAIGTVGLSMGITGSLTPAGKVVVMLLMFAGRLGPLTLGLAFLKQEGRVTGVRSDDLAV
ncbi:MAG: TrkH family potassium uptake protein [Phycisphaerales bacterium]